MSPLRQLSKRVCVEAFDLLNSVHLVLSGSTISAVCTEPIKGHSDERKYQLGGKKNISTFCIPLRSLIYLRSLSSIFFFSGPMPSFSYITVLYKNVVLECFCIFRNLRGSMGNLINTYSTTVRKNEVLGLSCTREIFSVETQITTKNRDVVLLINTYVCKLWKIIYIMAFKQLLCVPDGPRLQFSK